MKTLKKVGWESKLSHRPFFMFSPDAKASGRRWNTAQPVGGSAAANSQCNCLFSQTRLCVCESATLHSLCFHLLISPSGKLFVRQFHYIRKWVKGQCPLQRAIVCAISPPLPLPGAGMISLLGCGVKPRIVSSSPSGKLFEDQFNYFRHWVQGQCPWWVQGRCPCFLLVEFLTGIYRYDIMIDGR